MFTKKSFWYKKCREEFYFSILFIDNDLAYLLMTNLNMRSYGIISHFYIYEGFIMEISVTEVEHFKIKVLLMLLSCWTNTIWILEDCKV